MSWGRTFGGFVGAATSGPIGLFIGDVVGGLAEKILSLSADTLKETLTGLSAEAIRSAGERVANRLSPTERESVNHHLQAAFRGAAIEGLYDIGGARSFPSAWRGGRDVPEAAVYRLPRGEDELCERVAHALRESTRAIEAGRILPLEPPQARPEASIYHYLADERPLALAERFTAACIEPFLDEEFASLMAEAPSLRAHLRRHLLDRTLVHFGEFLKRPEYEAAWRAFSRLMLEGARDEIRALAAGQPELQRRIDGALGQLQVSTESLAEMVALVGGLERRIDEQVTGFLDRVVISHSIMQQRLQSLATLVETTDIKLAWVVEVLQRNLNRGATAPVESPPEAGAPPFQGLQPYTEADTDRFFGREALTARLAARVGALHRAPNAVRLLCVIGASGSGKSSLVLAGLIPALRGGGPLIDGSLPPAGSEEWVYRSFKPSSNPMAALAAALDGPRPDTGPRASPGRILLVVDQFEELFTACKQEDEQRRFVDELLAACGPGQQIIVVLTLRADFYAACARYEQLRELISRQQVFIGPMAGAELRAAIEEPARRGAWFFEGGLVNLILRDAGGQPGALPLISHALLETWKRRRGRTMTLESYAEAGGVHGAIARTADQTMAELTPQEQRIAKHIFLRLTELGNDTEDTRRRVAIKELVPRPEDAPLVEAVVQRLADARLITTEAERHLNNDQWVLSGERTAEVAHEALIREWRTLRRWLDEDREGLLVHQALTQDCKEWERLGRDPGALYRGSRLGSARDWATLYPERLNANEREFLQASLEAALQEERERDAARERELANARALADEQQRRADEGEAYSRRLAQRLRLLRALAVVIGMLAVAAGLLAYFANQQARVAFSNQLVAQTRAQAEDRDLALLLGVEASRRSNSPAAATALLSALEAAPNLLTFLHGHTDWVQAVAISQDGAWLASAGDDGRVLLWPIRDGVVEPQAVTLRDGGPRVRTLAFVPGGRWLALGDDAGTVALLPVGPGGGPGTTLRAAGPRVYSVAASRDGALLAAGDRDGTVLLFSLAGDAQPRELRGHSQAVRVVTFSPDGGLLASAGDDSRILLWDPATGEMDGRALVDYPKVDTLNDDIVSLAFSPDGAILAAGGWDMTINLWDVERRALFGPSLAAHTAPVLSIAFGAGGNTLISSSVDRTIIIWDLESGEPAGQPLAGHSSWVSSIALSPDGGTLAAGSGDGSISIWTLGGDSAFGQPVAGLHLADSTTVAYSPDGRVFATGGFDGSIQLRDAATGEPRGAPLKGHSGAISALSFDQAGGALISGSFDGSIMLWNVATGNPLARLFTEQTDPVLTVAVHPTEPLIVSANCTRINWASKLCDRSDLHFWNMESREHIERWPNIYEGPVSLMRYSPDGNWLLVGGRFDPLMICEAAGAESCERLFTNHVGILSAMALLRDGTTVATGSCASFDSANLCERGEVKFHDIRTFRTTREALSYDGPFVTALAVDPGRDQLFIGSQDGSMRVWDPGSGGLLELLGSAHTAPVTSLTFHPDGDTLVSTSMDGQLKLWDAASHSVRAAQPSGHSAAIVSVAISPDGATVASGGSDGTIQLWRADGASEPAPLDPGEWVRDLAFSRDGSALAASSGSFVTVFSSADGAIKQQFQDQTTWISRVDFSPDGGRLAGGGCALAVGWQGCDMGEIMIWDIERPSETVRLRGHGGAVLAVAYNPEGSLLASGGSDGSIALWDSASGEQVAPPWSGHGQDVFDLAFSPDGSLLATASRDTTVKIWNVAARTLALPPFAGHDDSVFGVAFSADGRLLASGGADDEVRVWDARTGDLVHVLRGHNSWINGLSFSGNQLLISGGRDGRAFVWDLSNDVESWQEQACAVAGRNLTRAEWERFLPGETYERTCRQWPEPIEATPGQAPTVVVLPTPTPPAINPTITPVDPASAILYRDDFSDRQSGWSRIGSSAGRQTYSDGRYLIEVDAENRLSWGLATVTLVDMELEVEARRMRGDVSSPYGVVLRAQDNQSFYAFLINDAGHYAFAANESGTWRTIVPPTAHTAIRTDGAGNTIGVRAEGDRFTLLVNGEELESISDRAFGSGDIGLIAGANQGQRDIAVSFDNMVVHQLSPAGR